MKKLIQSEWLINPKTKSNRLFFLIPAILALTLVLSGIPTLHARDLNGVTVTDFRLGSKYGMHIDHFSNFNPTSSTYIYNEAGESAVTSGEIGVIGNDGAKTLIISVPTLGSTSIDFRLECKVGISMTTWAEILVVNVAAATTIDIPIPISEYMTAYRLGVKVNTNGTDVINCSTSIITSK